VRDIGRQRTTSDSERISIFSGVFDSLTTIEKLEREREGRMC
jgi:hypothetical protein